MVTLGVVIVLLMMNVLQLQLLCCIWMRRITLSIFAPRTCLAACLLFACALAWGYALLLSREFAYIERIASLAGHGDGNKDGKNRETNNTAGFLLGA
jgi:hypothetical protein